MRDRFILGYVIGLVFALIGLSIGDFLRERIVSHGYASYEIVDQKTGKTEFRWKECK